MNFDQDSDSISRFARVLGVVLLGGGLVVFTLLLVTALQFLFEPESVFLIELFTEFLRSDAPPVTLTIEGQEVVVDIDSSVRPIFVVVVGAIALLGLGSILQALIGGGIQLLKYSSKKSDDGPT